MRIRGDFHWLSSPAALATLLLAAAWAPGAPVDFAREVQPILAARCYECHGPEKHKGGFRADSKSHAFSTTDSGERPVVPGDVEKSLLLKLVRSTDEDEFMPPKGERLTKEQLDVLARWIAEGATWPDAGASAPAVKSSHWAFNEPIKHAPPAVKNAAWVRNPIDAFILAEQEKAGLAPSGEADRHVLIRRATLDLTGLPPTPHEVNHFIAETGPDAYERLIDRLLASPAYGERWARVWMDIARYADSAGLGSDPLRHTAWPYRDWVIRAFNGNVPYDRFTIEQIAGDLLPNATRDQIVATAFHRNTMTNTEGGTDDEEWRIAAVKDRTNVTVQAWMGLTMGCTECHTHKYDPITQREYYSFFAFFNQTADTDQPNESPTIPVPTEQQERKRREITREIAKVQAQIDDPASLAVKQPGWERTVRDASTGWVVLEPTAMTSVAGATLAKQPDGSIVASGARGDSNDVYTIIAPTDLRDVTAFRIEALPDPSLPGAGPGRGDDGNFVLSHFEVAVQPKGERKTRGRFVRLELAGEKRMLHIAELQAFSGEENVAPKGTATQSSTAFAAAADRAIDGRTDGVFANNSVSHTDTESDPFWELDLKDVRELDKLVLWPRMDGAALNKRLDGLRISVLDENRKRVWTKSIDKGPGEPLTLSVDGPSGVALEDASASFEQVNYPPSKSIDGDLGPHSGWAVAPQFGRAHSASFAVAGEPVGHDRGAVLTFKLTQNHPKLPLGRFRLSATNRPRPVRMSPGDVADILAVAANQRTAAQRARITEYFRSVAPHLAPQRERIAQLNKALSEIKPPQVAIMRELPPDKRRETHLLVKGNWMSKGDAVQPAVPAAFNPLPKGAPHNRLGVALWIIDPENPLTARVAVNRFWASLFGAGIVFTQEDFGTMGEPPTHPGLLDWLAVTFREDLKWDVKALLKLILTSSTYRQSSQVTPDLLERDPANKLLARAPRLRLEAEAVRDQALALSGLLSPTLFGPSVYPPQPPNLWQAAFNGERKYPTSTGGDRYRRGLYTFWRRTVPYPSMAAFDAPSREQCTVRRIHTSTPIQALVTLNDPVYVEAAQALARRIAKEGGATVADRAKWALELCLARPASAEQVKHVVALYDREVEHYSMDAAAAKTMATDPLGPLPAGADAAELAAWTVVSNVLLNLDGVLTKS